MYDAVVFDMDGVLVELTETRTLRRGAVAAFESHGVDSPPETLVDRLADQDFDALDDAHDRYDLDPETLWRSREEHVHRTQREAIADGGKPLFDDVTALSLLSADRALVSNNQHATVEFVLEHYGLADRFETAYGRDHTLDGAKRKKPNPHYIERALEDLGTREALYVGDNPKDVIAADRADLDSALLRRPHRDPVSLDRDPTYHVESLSDLVARLGAGSDGDSE
jgi:HAD superfamily hydrolase (TIGR01549 family)